MNRETARVVKPMALLAEEDQVLVNRGTPYLQRSQVGSIDSGRQTTISTSPAELVNEYCSPLPGKLSFLGQWIKSCYQLQMITQALPY